MTKNQNEGFEMPSQTVFEQQMEELRTDMREMRGAVTKMAEALTKLSVLEERNLAANVAIEKIATRVEKVEEKVNGVELEQVKFESTVEGVTKTMRFMWGAFGGGVIYLGSQIIKHFAPAAGG
jgi:hypothetical protein